MTVESDLYETDILEWSAHQAELLRRVAAGERVNGVDWPNVIEEVESVGRSERSALASHIRVVLEHLAKLVASPATEPRAGWRQTVLRERAAIEELLDASPSLRPKLDDMVKAEMGRVRPIVADALAQYGETARVGVDSISFTRDQVRGPWLPSD